MLKVRKQKFAFLAPKQSKRIEYEAIYEIGVFDRPECASTKSKITTKLFHNRKALLCFTDE